MISFRLLYNTDKLQLHLGIHLAQFLINFKVRKIKVSFERINWISRILYLSLPSVKKAKKINPVDLDCPVGRYYCTGVDPV